MFILCKYDDKNQKVASAHLTMTVEDELRGGWREGSVLTVRDSEYILTSREFDKKSRSVMYELRTSEPVTWLSLD